jgi:hypothetical protein
MIRTFTHYAKLATKGKTSGSDLSRVYANAFSQLSNLNGAEITRLATKLRQDQDLDFNRGVDDAAAIACFKLRTLKDEQNHPLVAKAMRVAQAKRSSMERSQIAGMMIVLSYERNRRTIWLELIVISGKGIAPAPAASTVCRLRHIEQFVQFGPSRWDPNHGQFSVEGHDANCDVWCRV